MNGVWKVYIWNMKRDQYGFTAGDNISKQGHFIQVLDSLPTIVIDGYEI